MEPDPIIEEVRRIRQEYAERFGYARPSPSLRRGRGDGRAGGRGGPGGPGAG